MIIHALQSNTLIASGLADFDLMLRYQARWRRMTTLRASCLASGQKPHKRGWQTKRQQALASP
ncbi:hypothetical protein [Deefgea sp. CFH1-16]|uniref:hypothetical protein n=1 Tax=Deefgea sp. CFH1-16 TaxID=2675457 RepID=UPI0015F4B970|nr:hypothetical protein [Deefgea sp. CFH1-16]MBM5575548.1 hypothetical protein [Deefgea sp. CFH1-16]